MSVKEVILVRGHALSSRALLDKSDIRTQVDTMKACPDRCGHKCAICKMQEKSNSLLLQGTLAYDTPVKTECNLAIVSFNACTVGIKRMHRKTAHLCSAQSDCSSSQLTAPTFAMFFSEAASLDHFGASWRQWPHQGA